MVGHKEPNQIEINENNEFVLCFFLSTSVSADIVSVEHDRKTLIKWASAGGGSANMLYFQSFGGCSGNEN